LTIHCGAVFTAVVAACLVSVTPFILPRNQQVLSTPNEAILCLGDERRNFHFGNYWPSSERLRASI
jgi:hypothetical protein